MVSIEQPEGRPSLVIQDEGMTPEQALENTMTVMKFYEAITQLTEGQKQVIAPRFFGGYTSKEVAKIMGMKDGAIRGLQHRGLSALREILSKGE